MQFNINKVLHRVIHDKFTSANTFYSIGPLWGEGGSTNQWWIPSKALHFSFAANVKRLLSKQSECKHFKVLRCLYNFPIISFPDLVRQLIPIKLYEPRPLGNISISPPGQNGHHSAKDILQSIFMNGNFCILISIPLHFVPKGQINNKAALIQVMAWGWTGDKPLLEPMLTQFTDAYMWH